ncbi:hypothetical protein P9112_005736 [Eukaryota sp. TZLM1-RC]
MSLNDNLISFEEDNSPFLEALVGPEFKDELDFIQDHPNSSAILLPLQPLLQDELIFSATFVQTHLCLIEKQADDSIKFISRLGTCGVINDGYVYLLNQAVFEVPCQSFSFSSPLFSTSTPFSRIQLIRTGHSSSLSIPLFLISSTLPEPGFIHPLTAQYLKRKRRITIQDLLLSTPSFFSSPLANDPKKPRSRSNSIYEDPKSQEVELTVKGSYSAFMSRLRSLDLSPNFRQLNSFLFDLIKNNYQPDWLVEWLPEVVSKLLSMFAPTEVLAMTNEVPFECVNGSVSAEFVYDCVEKLVFNKIYNYCFPCSMMPEGQNVTSSKFKNTSSVGPFGYVDVTKSVANERDSKFHSKVVHLRHLPITFDSLDISVDLSRHPLWTEAGKWLGNLNKLKAPRDKLVCICNACRSLLTVLSATSIGTSFGADLFLPSLVLLLINYVPFNFESNIDFIRCWRPPIKGEASYFITSTVIAIEFIKGMNLEDYTQRSQSSVKKNKEKSCLVKTAQVEVASKHPLSEDSFEKSSVDDGINNDVDYLTFKDCNTVEQVLKNFCSFFGIELSMIEHLNSLIAGNVEDEVLSVGEVLNVSKAAVLALSRIKDLI